RARSEAHRRSISLRAALHRESLDWPQPFRGGSLPGDRGGRGEGCDLRSIVADLRVVDLAFQFGELIDDLIERRNVAEEHHLHGLVVATQVGKPFIPGHEAEAPRLRVEVARPAA